MARLWPTREEWAAAAEHSVRTACMPLERVAEGAEHYLSTTEFAELNGLYVTLSAAVRAPLTAEIKRLQALLPSPIPHRPLDRARWYDALTAEQQSAWQALQALRNARLEIGRRAQGQTYTLIGWLRSSLKYSVLSPQVAPFVVDVEGLRRLAELEAKYTQLREQAAQVVEAAAIAKAIEVRNSDEGWAKELERRARIDDGPVVVYTHPVTQDHEPTT
ncbi:hypothetical protein [Streptosporangium roseum]|uniref:hypothetical protein n=1 Tax=Streptosporangium roseum TaxID=2001 RepID=UPI0004CD52FB|nr:hypothetical protein [Streptosporangium roseum]